MTDDSTTGAVKLMDDMVARGRQAGLELATRSRTEAEVLRDFATVVASQAPSDDGTLRGGMATMVMSAAADQARALADQIDGRPLTLRVMAHSLAGSPKST